MAAGMVSVDLGLAPSRDVPHLEMLEPFGRVGARVAGSVSNCAAPGAVR
jgi:hypothetical protein